MYLSTKIQKVLIAICKTPCKTVNDYDPFLNIISSQM